MVHKSLGARKVKKAGIINPGIFLNTSLRIYIYIYTSLSAGSVVAPPSSRHHGADTFRERALNAGRE